MEIGNVMDDSLSIEMLALALVREYLSRKGFKHTLNLFDKETGKKDTSVQNRKILAEKLRIIHLVKTNKEQGVKTLRSFLEMIVRSLIDKKSESKQDGRKDTLSTKYETEEHNYTSKNSNTIISPVQHFEKSIVFSSCNEITPLMSPLKGNTKIPRYKHSKKTSGENLMTMHKRTADHIQNGVFSPDNSSAGDLDNHAVRRKKSSSFPTDADTSKNVERGSNCSDFVNTALLEKNSSFIEKIKKNKTAESHHDGNNNTTNSITSNGYNKIDILELDDFDFVDNKLHNSPKRISSPTNHSEAISSETAVQLKSLLFGSATTFFNQEWKMQGFKFCKHPLLKYGLVQDKGGPCGLLACLQAVFLKQLLFSDGLTKVKIVQPSEQQQSDCLINSFIEILWRARSNNHVIVAMPTPQTKFTSVSNYKNDGLTEKLQLFHFEMKSTLKTFLTRNISWFTKNNGCVLFLYATILTAGVQNIRNSMDEANTTLIGRHGYCTQEMVNLMLTGKSVSNVFDGVIQLGSDVTSKSCLHGIQNRTTIGFLSLFEHYDSCKVGENYKIPHYPIWVVCSESHFSVLFSTEDVNNQEKIRFDLFYYDGLANQDEEIKLTIQLGSGRRDSPPKKSDLIPPLEHCIRTRWKRARVSWNDTEPIL